MQSMIVMPDNHEYEDISAVFQRKTNIPQLISAIDGTHIPILLPTDGYRDFINLPGASNDAAVLKNSNLYKNCNLLIPPIGYTKSNRLTPEEESFNVYLNSGRVCVEIAFGKLKARWLIKRIDIHYSYVPHIISACCILHNIVETHKEKFLQAWEYINESNVNQQPESLRTQDLDNFNA
ncbi:hypothetical protein ACFW04_013380 [Cataglyphis niger]